MASAPTLRCRLKGLRFLPPLQPGYKRAYRQCGVEDCGRVGFYDFVPYSLSNPIRTMPCGHLFEWAKGLEEAAALPLILQQRDVLAAQRGR